LRKERIEKEAALYKSSFREFVEAAWPIVEPGATFMGGYHIDAICEHLQACSRGDISRLIINIPPRLGKTTLISILYPAWLWTVDPTERMLVAGYGIELSRRASTSNRRVVKTDWYRQRFPYVELSDDLDTKTTFENTATGVRQTTSVGGPTTGLGGTHLLLDDPNSAQQAESAAVRETTLQWFRESWSTRLNPGRQVSIVVQQRLHQSDISGYCIAEGGWTHLCLPMSYEGNKTPTSIGWVDPRTEPGELLWKERFDNPKGRAELDTLKRTLGSVGVAGQLQQRPVPRGGSIFKMKWLRFYYDEDQCQDGAPEPVCYLQENGTMAEAPQRARPAIDPASVISSWDMAFKGGEKNDFVVGQAWAGGLKGEKANRFLLAQRRGHWDFPDTVAAVRSLNAQVSPYMTIVEERASGNAVIQSLQNEIQGVIPINPEGGKESRASAVAPLFEAGNVWLPHPSQAPWIQDYIDELMLFPRGKNDDQVDATTQALNRMRTTVVEDIDMSSSVKSSYRTPTWRD
jgi:predicted phage terminase large subunit-like protein